MPSATIVAAKTHWLRLIHLPSIVEAPSNPSGHRRWLQYLHDAASLGWRPAHLAADDRGNAEPELGTTVLIRADAVRTGGEDGRAHYLAVVAGERAGLRVELGAKPV